MLLSLIVVSCFPLIQSHFSVILLFFFFSKQLWKLQLFIVWIKVICPLVRIKHYSTHGHQQYCLNAVRFSSQNGYSHVNYEYRTASLLTLHFFLQIKYNRMPFIRIRVYKIYNYNGMSSFFVFELQNMI